ncbi:MAG TPA: hypothetical protein VG028_15855 [Terriglobia bacterium]|nr:hypothetical protein [Terriglobia bacterium]
MPKQSRRKLFTMMGAGMLASRMGWAAAPDSSHTRAPQALVNAIGVRLRKSSGGTTVLAIDYGGTLDAGNHLHAIGGQLEFAHQPTERELARALKKALIQKVAQVPGVNLAARDITVVGPTFL